MVNTLLLTAIGRDRSLPMRMTFPLTPILYSCDRNLWLGESAYGAGNKLKVMRSKPNILLYHSYIIACGQWCGTELLQQRDGI